MDSSETTQSGEINLTLRDYVRVLFRQKAVILTAIVTVCLTAFVGLKIQPRLYEASVKMIITAEKKVEAAYYRDSNGSQKENPAITQSEIVRSETVLSRVVKAQALQDRPLDDEIQFASPLRARVIKMQADAARKEFEALPPLQANELRYRRAMDSLKASVRVDPVRDTNMFTITVRDFNPVGAAILANTLSRAYVIFDLQQQLVELSLKYGSKHPKIVYLRENIAKMERTLDGQPLQDMEALGPASVKIIEQSTVPVKPTGTSKSLTFILAIVMSLFLGVMLAFIFEYADQTIKMPLDIDQTLAIPFIGSVRRRGFLQRALVDFKSRRLTPYGHSLQTICEQIYLMLKDRDLKLVMLGSTLNKEDTTAVTANLGQYFSGHLQRKVLIIDADIRRPSLHKVYKFSNTNGLADVLENRISWKEGARKVSERLAVLPAGETDLNSLLLFETPAMKALLEDARQTFDLVLVRSCAISTHKDPTVLAALTDTVLLVVSEGRVRRQVVHNAFDPLKTKARHLLGVLLVNRTYPVPRWLYDVL